MLVFNRLNLEEPATPVLFPIRMMYSLLPNNKYIPRLQLSNLLYADLSIGLSYFLNPDAGRRVVCQANGTVQNISIDPTDNFSKYCRQQFGQTVKAPVTGGSGWDKIQENNEGGWRSLFRRMYNKQSMHQ